MSIIQLNPSIPVWTTKGEGYAIGWMDYSQEHHLMWIVALNDGGAVWVLENPHVRLCKNPSIARTKENENQVAVPHSHHSYYFGTPSEEILTGKL